ncbi:hypothetical protein [Tessaracoccus sp. Z1128]
MELEVVCTAGHAPVELATFAWAPADLDDVAVWDNSTPLRQLAMDTVRQSARATKSSRPNKVTQRAPVERHTRADGGTTYIIPPCPRCLGRAVPLRDDTIRRYAEKTRDTPMEGRLDVAHVRMV